MEQAGELPFSARGSLDYRELTVSRRRSGGDGAGWSFETFGDARRETVRSAVDDRRGGRCRKQSDNSERCRVTGEMSGTALVLDIVARRRCLIVIGTSVAIIVHRGMHLRHCAGMVVVPAFLHCHCLADALRQRAWQGRREQHGGDDDQQEEARQQAAGEFHGATINQTCTL